MELHVKDQNLLICLSANSKDVFNFSIYVYLDDGGGKFELLFKKDFNDKDIVSRRVPPEADWVETVKLSKDRTIQLVVHLTKGPGLHITLYNK